MNNSTGSAVLLRILLAVALCSLGDFFWTGVSGFVFPPVTTIRRSSTTSCVEDGLTCWTGGPSMRQILATKHRADSVLRDTQNDEPQVSSEGTLRASLRRATGFSLTALRATCRTATGISFTAVYLAALAATGNWIRQTTKFVLSVFPPWARYFVQPFLILYYVPIFILRNVTGPTRQQARKTHEAVLDSWKAAIQRADEKVSYWPVHVNEDGMIESDTAEIDVREAVVDSLEVARDEEATK